MCTAILLFTNRRHLKVGMNELTQTENNKLKVKKTTKSDFDRKWNLTEKSPMFLFKHNNS